MSRSPGCSRVAGSLRLGVCPPWKCIGLLISAPLEGRREVSLEPRGSTHHSRPGPGIEVHRHEDVSEGRKASLYATFPPAKAPRLAQRLERHHSPKHGSWLKIAESETSALVRTGLPERVERLTEFGRRIRAAVKRRNRTKAATDWQFTNGKARVKLKSLYPSVLD